MTKPYSISITFLLLALAGTASAATYQTDTFLSQDDAAGYLDEPRGFDTDADDIYVLDTINNRIEKVKSDGSLERVAGSGEYGYKNDSALNAQFAEPQDIAVFGDNAEQIFIADTNNNVIRKLENGVVSTFLTGLSGPKGVVVEGDTVFVSDTGNNRILGVNRAGGSITVFASGLSQPTKLLYWPEARSIIFVNAGEGTVRAVNVSTGVVSDLLISELEDIGGLFLQKRNLFVVSSYSIGVFNEIWKVRLAEANPSGSVTASSTKQLSLERETENLNWPSDVFVQEDTLSWEEYYSWDTNLIFQPAAKKKTGPTCGLNFREAGQRNWRDIWYIRADKDKTVYSQNYLLRPKYQGDQVFFRLRTQYDNKKLNKTKRKNQRDHNQSAWEQSRIFALGELRSSRRKSRRATIHWPATLDATSYNVQLWHNDERVKTFRNLTVRKKKITKKYLQANQDYQFRVQGCTAGTCGDWSEFKTFRTKPAKAKRVGKIVPHRGVRMTALDNGLYKAELQFSLHKPYKHQRVQVELCAKEPEHADTVTAKRIYVLYKGGSAILAWHSDGTLPELIAGSHRFQQNFAESSEALLGRPKDVAFSSDQQKMYMSVNNQLVVYDFATDKLSALAGHVMDSYREGAGTAARMSDPTAIALSPDDQWLYFVDRNNHRIRKLNTDTGETSYVTGAGGNNFAFTTQDSNGYAEGGPCADEFDLAVAGCAYFNRPTGIVVSPDGKTLYVAEGSNNRIRSVNATTGQTSLIAGDGSTSIFNGPYTLGVSSDGSTLYVADKYNSAIKAVNLSTKKVTTVVSGLSIPEYVKEDNGMLYWTEAGSHKVRAMSLTSRVVMTLSGNGNVGYVNGTDTAAEWHNPKGFDFRAGKLYVADTMNDVIRTISL
ncbi:MAG: lipoprotein [uncultured bacterium]|nr:MAG: lipoprotein [uncultured bacterium]HBY73408.1 hypothetical protein [Candidatus Kerfeldbacteria bacterium]